MLSIAKFTYALYSYRKFKKRKGELQMSFNMAIIGMGGMAGWHVNNIREHIPEIKIVGGYDVREEANTKARDEWGVKVYTSPEEIYADKDIDIVLIATPNDVHKDYSINCMEAGKHVICEKPVTMDAPELVEILAVAKKTGKLFSVHQNRRWDKDYLTIRKILADGMLKNPYNIESRVQGSRPLYGWRLFKQNGGGLLLDWGIHLLDQMLDLVPSKVTSVQAHLHYVYGNEVDDSFTVLLRFENGVSGMVSISTNCFVPLPRWHVSCVDGTAVVDDWELGGKIVKQADPDEKDWTVNLVYTAAGPTRIMLPRPKETTIETPLPEVTGTHWTDYYKNIVDTLNGKAELMVTGEQALRVMKVIDAVFESGRTGVAVTTGI